MALALNRERAFTLATVTAAAAAANNYWQLGQSISRGTRVVYRGVKRVLDSSADGNGRMPPRKRRRVGPKRRRAYGKRRGPSRRRSGLRRRGKGWRSRGQRGVKNRGLNTNMSRNDFDSVRDISRNSETFLFDDTGPAVYRRTSKLEDFALAISKSADYNQYKMTNVQVVLTPKFPLGIYQGHKGVQGDGEMYGAIYPRSRNDNPAAVPLWQTVKKTPGVRLFKLDSTRRIILNLVPFITEVITTEQGITIDKQRNLGWSDVIQGIPDNLELCPYSVFIPQAAIGSNKVEWRLDTYATFIFRGNKDLIDDS